MRGREQVGREAVRNGVRVFRSLALRRASSMPLDGITLAPAAPPSVLERRGRVGEVMQMAPRRGLLLARAMYARVDGQGVGVFALLHTAGTATAPTRVFLLSASKMIEPCFPQTQLRVVHGARQAAHEDMHKYIQIHTLSTRILCKWTCMYLHVFDCRERQTTSFIDYSIEAGFLLGGNGAFTPW